jgi:hypothetical protein
MGPEENHRAGAATENGARPAESPTPWRERRPGRKTSMRSCGRSRPRDRKPGEAQACLSQLR